MVNRPSIVLLQIVPNADAAQPGDIAPNAGALWRPTPPRNFHGEDFPNAGILVAIHFIRPRHPSLDDHVVLLADHVLQEGHVLVMDASNLPSFFLMRPPHPLVPYLPLADKMHHVATAANM